MPEARAEGRPAFGRGTGSHKEVDRGYMGSILIILLQCNGFFYINPK